MSEDLGLNRHTSGNVQQTSVQFSPAIDRLVTLFKRLPGVGPKSAQWLALHLLQNKPKLGRQLSESIVSMLDTVRPCEQCRNFSETEVCNICSDTQRNRALLCVVESPLDVIAIEQTGRYSGIYFVLRGRLSPIDGIGPEALGIDQLTTRFASGELEEVILATNLNAEGEATAHYITQIASDHPVRITRLASGVPMGGELEYLDSRTLSHALARREVLHTESL